MFLKRCSRKKCGKDHVYWQLVESYRTARGSRHRVVAYLGGLSKAERRGWARLAATLDGKAAGKARQLSLLEPPSDPDDEPVPDPVEVQTRSVRLERTRDFGDVFLALVLWRMLGLTVSVTVCPSCRQRRRTLSPRLYAVTWPMSALTGCSSLLRSWGRGVRLA